MFRPRVIPCLLLHNKGLVKTIKFQNPTYVGDPMNAVKIFNDFEADELMFLDIDASKENRTISLKLIEKIGDESFMPFAVGGGIKNIEEIKNILNAGAEKVVLNTNAIKNPDLVRKAAEIFGNQSIIVSIDVKKNNNGKYEVFIYGGTKSTGLDPVSIAKKMESYGAGEILINSIDKEGTFEGYDLDLIKIASDSVKIPVIANGGARDLEDLYNATKQGATAVAAGSMFVFIGKNRAVLINYPDKEEMRTAFKNL